MRKQYHFWPGDRGIDAWDVDRLLALSAGLAVEEVPLSEIGEIDSVYWFDDRRQRATVRRLVEHVELILAADLSYPIILGPDGRVMDGMHRVARAMHEGRTNVLAVRLPTIPAPDYCDCRPEDLPYDDAL